MRLRLINAGLIWQAGNWTLELEALRRHSNSLVTASGEGWYALLSRRFDSLTPYVAYGGTRFLEGPLNLQAAPGALPAVATDIAGLDLSLQSPLDRRIAMVGLRWDLHEQAALKLQLEHWRATRDTTTPRNEQIVLPAGAAGWNGRVNLLSVSLDFVF